MKSNTNKDEESEKQALYKNSENYTSKIGVRHLIAIMAFLALFNDYALDTNLTVALVAMVNDTDNLGTNLSNNTSIFLLDEEKTSQQAAQFNWDKEMQGILLSSIYYGLITSQIPAGIICKRVGSKCMLGYGVLLSAIASLFTPLAAMWNVYALLVIRILLGIGEGLTAPAIYDLWSHWAPKFERSQLVAFTYAGSYFGTFLCLPVSGILIEKNVFGGWPSVFYVFGAFAGFWCILWVIVGSDSPKKHWFISSKEKIYIENSIEVHNETFDIPWRSILTSKPMWALTLLHFSSNWYIYTLITCLPMYMKDVLHFGIKKNALLSGLPYLFLWCMNVICGYMTDFICRKKYLTIGNTRKLMTTLGFLLPSTFLIAINYIGYNPQWEVAMVFLGIGMFAFGSSNYFVNHLDLAPPFAGVLYSITNTIATIPGMLSPYIVGVITYEKHTSEEWKIIFFISVAIYMFGCGLFLIFGSGDIQPWAYEGKEKAYTSIEKEKKVTKEENERN